MKPMPSRQRGVTLFVGLIMLVLLTMLGLSAYNAGKGSMQIVGNVQQRNQATAAAQEAIEEASARSASSSTRRPSHNPTVEQYRCVTSGDGTNDVTVTVGDLHAAAPALATL
jgi:Tfp pilus assembly protein PilX